MLRTLFALLIAFSPSQFQSIVTISFVSLALCVIVPGILGAWLAERDNAKDRKHRERLGQ